MAWNYQKEGHSTAEESRTLRIFFAVLFSFGALGAVIAGALDFSGGAPWVGVRHLAMALQFSVLAAKGPQLWASRAVGARLLFGVAFLVYLVLFVIQVVVPLVR